jgi:hypothetical protein
VFESDNGVISRKNGHACLTVFHRHLRLPSTFLIAKAFCIVENGGMLISAARERSKTANNVTIRFHNPGGPLKVFLHLKSYLGDSFG